ncbi:MAG: DUF72 domain-containing protein [Candidatus Micrarchaeia archaeon]
MEAFVGTSGWMYSWNKGGTLDWYAENSKLNAIELNASFYRFPFPNQVKHWTEIGRDLAWSIKVNRLITHQYKLGMNCWPVLSKFLSLFKPLEESIHYYLFQLPNLLTPNILDNVESLLGEFDISAKFAIEPRSQSWFNDETFNRMRKLGITFVSIDSPIGVIVKKTSSSVYMRMHGRRSWYSYNYSGKELAATIDRISSERPKNAYVFFNNDHDMLGNARAMMKLLKGSSGRR